MLDTFLNLAAVAGQIGTVTAAELHPNGFISIELVADDGTPHTLTYHAAWAKEPEAGNGNS